MNTSDLRRRAGPLLVARCIQLVQGFAVSALILWRYGLEGAGTYALASFSSTCAILFVAFGLGNALPRAGFSLGGRATLGIAVTALVCLPAGLVIGLYSLQLGRTTAEVEALLCLGLAGALGGQVNVIQMLCILQDRVSLSVVAPAIHLAGAVVAVLAPSFPTFCMALLATRIVGNLGGALGLTYGRVRVAEAWPVVRDGLRYLPLDLVNLVADQISIVVIAGLVSRAELGLFGLVRQLLTLADSPGWSFVTANYPRLVADIQGCRAPLARENQKIAWITAGACLVLTAALALAVYRQPALIEIMPVVLLCLPARYANNFYDQGLRAAGWTNDCLQLSLLKLGVSLCLVFGLTHVFGLWGAVSATTLLSCFGGYVFRRQFRWRFPQSFAASPSWRFA